MPPEIDYVVYKAGWLEIIWLAITLIATLVIFLLLRVAILNKRALSALGQNGIREYAADTQIIREILRLAIMVPLLIIGGRAAMLPNYHGTRTFDYYLAIACLIAIPIGMAVKGVVDWYRFMSLLRRIQVQNISNAIAAFGLRKDEPPAPPS